MRERTKLHESFIGSDGRTYYVFKTTRESTSNRQVIITHIGTRQHDPEYMCCPDRPAFLLERDKKDGTHVIESERWFKNNKLHSYNDHAAYRELTTDYFVEEWYQDGIKHRDNDMPAYVAYNYDRTIAKAAEWWVNGEKHREAGPASIHWNAQSCFVQFYQNNINCRKDITKPSTYSYGYSPDSFARREIWTDKAGRRHRDGDMPAMITVKNDGSEDWTYTFHGEAHRDNGPSFIQFYNGKVTQEVFYYKGDLTSIDDKPTIVRYDSDGKVLEQYWHYDHAYHRDNGPAHISYGTKGQLVRETWYQYGKEHRPAAPAVIYYAFDGSIATELWYKQGKEIESSIFEGMDETTREFTYNMIEV